MRARILLMAAEGRSNQEIAERLSLPVLIVTRWRYRVQSQRLAGLDERQLIDRPLSMRIRGVSL